MMYSPHGAAIHGGRGEGQLELVGIQARQADRQLRSQAIRKSGNIVRICIMIEGLARDGTDHDRPFLNPFFSNL